MLGVLKRKWKPKRASSSNGHHHNNNQNGRLLEPPAASAEVRAAPSARQIHPVYGEKAQLLAYENEQEALLHRHLQHAAAVAAVAADASAAPAPPPPAPPAPPYLCIPPPAGPPPPLPPAYPLAPNICVEGGRIEFIRPPLDGAASDDKERALAPAAHGLGGHGPAPPIPPHGPGHRRAGSSGGTVSRAQQTQTPPPDDDTHSEEKCDLAKEGLEARVSELESLLEAERRCCARERSAVQRLQRQLSKREAARRDVDRERYLRLDSAAEAEQCKARLAALQRDLARMEEALRCMLQYKTRCSQLKQDKAALAAAYEARVQQCQTTISRLSQENEALKKQVKTLEAQQQGGGAVQQALLERLRALESDNRLLSTDAEQQRRQYERCLDDVANQVVRALLSQKGLREEIGALQQRIRELEGQNRALTSLLVQQLQNGEQDFKQITAGEVTSPEQGAADDMVTLSKPRLRRPTGRHRPSPTCGGPAGGPCGGPAGSPCGGQAHDDTTAAILAAVASIDPALWLQVARPQSLHLAPSLEGAQEMVARDGRDGSATDLSSWQQDIKQAVAEAEAAAAAAVGASSSVDGVDAMAEAVAAAVAEDDQDGSSSPESSPESGNRDEGYSTMSSDVQAEASSRLTGAGESASSSAAQTGLGLLGLGLGACTELEDVKEEAEQVLPDVVAELVVGGQAPGVQGRQPAAGAAAGRLLLLDLQALNVRHSFPPARDLQVGAVLRNSFSDSHLCLSRLLHHAAAASFASTPASCPAATAHKPVLLVDLGAGHAAATAKPHPLRRARATPSLLTPPLPPLQLVAEELAEHGDEEDLGLAAGWWDADYVQHWLRLDETRSALQQRHREAYELEYDQAELEDWSLSLSCEELDLSWRRTAPAPPPAPVEAPGSTHGNPQLPIIQENNSLELEEDASECLWNNASYLDAGPAAVGGGPRGCHGAGLGLGLGGAGWPYALSLVEQADAMISSLAVNAAGSSPGGSWSSSAAASDCYDCCLNGCHGEEGSSKRSSAALSGCSDESAATGTSAASRESPSAVGTDFTRDFYRLVKFESTKSLASNSSSRNSRGQGQGHHGDNNINNNLPTSMDREQALQSVLKFIAEQQKYCHSREEQDSATELGSRPVSYAYSMEEEGAGPAEPGAEPPESIESLEPVSLSTFSEVDIDVDADLDVLDLEAANGEEQQQVSLEGQEGEAGVVEEWERPLTQGQDDVERVATGVTAVTALLDEISVAAGVTASLETVLEDEELDTTPSGRRQLQSLREASSSPAPTAAAAAASAPAAVSVLVCDANDKAVSFHENATSKDVIDELNRMIRKGEGEEAALAVSADAHPRPKCGRPPGEVAAAASVDSAALSCPTGWVHVERDIDFTDPKARANLLDVMLASSASSGSMSSSGSESGDAEDLPADYRHLHRLHRFRRHKKASAFRDPFGVLRFPSCNIRPSIIGRDDFFVRYGEKEREAMASFDFLDDMSSASISCASGASSTLGSLQKLDAASDLAHDDDGGGGRGTPTARDAVDAAAAAEDSDERMGGQLSLSDSCGNSLSGSRSSLEDCPQDPQDPTRSVIPMCQPCPAPALSPGVSCSQRS